MTAVLLGQSLEGSTWTLLLHCSTWVKWNEGHFDSQLFDFVQGKVLMIIRVGLTLFYRCFIVVLSLFYCQLLKLTLLAFIALLAYSVDWC